MSIVPETRTGAGYLPSGKDIATLQRQVADLENKKETLRKQCNFFDSLLKQKAGALSKLDTDDIKELAERNSEYVKIVEQYDQLWSGLQQGQEDLEKLNEAQEKARIAKEKSESELAEVEDKLSTRTKELEKTLANVDVEKVAAIRERDNARSENARLMAESEKLKTDMALHKETIAAERELINQEKNVLTQQVRDMAIKYGRLQRIAAKLNVKGV